MPFAYARPLTTQERAVQALGFPWVSTTNLGPSGRLGDHVHSSYNTHVIVRGTLTIVPRSGIYHNEDGTRHVVSTNRTGALQQLDVRPRQWYRGIAGPEGAVFVEGHTILSPTTARRFESRQDLAWYDDGSGQTRDEWFAQQRQQQHSNRRRFL